MAFLTGLLDQRKVRRQFEGVGHAFRHEMLERANLAPRKLGLLGEIVLGREGPGGVRAVLPAPQQIVPHWIDTRASQLRVGRQIVVNVKQRGDLGIDRLPGKPCSVQQGTHLGRF